MDATLRSKVRFLTVVLAIAVLAARGIYAVQPDSKSNQEFTDIELSQDVAGNIKAILTHSTQALVCATCLKNHLSNKVAGQQRQRFDELLDQLAGQIDEALLETIKPLAGKRIEYNLITIAQNRKENPQLYRDLLSRYGESIDKDLQLKFRAPKPPPLVHCTSEYRAFWEYCLLAPQDRRIGFMAQSSLPLKALSRIKEDSSLPALAQFYQVNLLQGLLTGKKNGGDHILLSMTIFRSHLALKTILGCLNFAENLPLDQADQVWHYRFVHHPTTLKKTDVKTHRELISALLSGPEYRSSDGAVYNWKPVLENYPTESLSTRDRNLIQQALITYSTRE